MFVGQKQATDLVFRDMDHRKSGAFLLCGVRKMFEIDTLGNQYENEVIVVSAIDE